MDMTLRIIITIGIGLLVGLEREYSSNHASKLFAGVRTFPLIALLGFLAAYLAEFYTLWVFVGAFVAFAVLLTMAYFVQSQTDSRSGVTEISALVTFFTGALVYRQEVIMAVEVAVATALMLSLKLQFRSALGKIDQEDVFAVVKFLIMTAIILPTLPDQPMGPYNAINPRNVWYMVVLISSVSFTGYFISKFAGASQGIMLTSVLGGVASSTVLTYDFAEKSRQDESIARQYGVGIIVASAIMFVRLWVLIYVLYPALAMLLLAPFSMMAAAGGVVAILLIRRYHLTQSASNVGIENPLNVKGALKFAGVFTAVLLLVRVAEEYFGNQGIYAVSALSGTVEMDAIAISMTKFAQTTQGTAQQSAQTIARNAILIAVLANTIVKYGIVWVLAAKEVHRLVLVGFGAMMLLGAVWLLF